MDNPVIQGLTVITALYHAIGPANLITGLIAINFIAFALFGIDKARAEQGAWRIKESTLLMWALFGGTPGAYAGRALFRHKTRKQSFNDGLEVIVMIQLCVLAGLAAWWFWPG